MPTQQAEHRAAEARVQHGSFRELIYPEPSVVKARVLTSKLGDRKFAANVLRGQLAGSERVKNSFARERLHDACGVADQ